jgi:hypothetical protein
VTDIFLPKSFADRIFPICGTTSVLLEDEAVEGLELTRRVEPTMKVLCIRIRRT